MRRSYALILALPLLLNGCGSGSSNSNSSSSSGSISGNWQMSLQKSNSTLQPKTQSGFLVQNGENVGGSVLFTDIPCSGIGNVTGTVSGTDVSLVVDPVGIEVNLSGTVGSGQTSMSGNYTILSTGCSGTETAPQTGAWTANLVSPFSGNIQGTFVSTPHSATYAITGSVKQGSNTGVSTAPLTGTMSATGYCFATANITGSIGGTAVVIDLADTDGVEVGQIIGTSSLDGTSFAGTYQILGLGSTVPPPCGDGDSGTVTFSLS
ncbi:MAG TPA: hypothetical protein VK722_19340 [Candidatus Aquilonibacter sp.]|jgi:hypothetical protein|nr:hypothetical protein [Candidatus Aquilonibacter sp.]